MFSCENETYSLSDSRLCLFIVKRLCAWLSPRSYGHMIDNVMMLITGGLNDISINQLIPKCHPMGNFDGMAAVQIATTVEELYSAILIDTPIGESEYS